MIIYVFIYGIVYSLGMYVTPSTHPIFPADIQHIIWIAKNIIIFAKYLYLLINLVIIHFIIMTGVKKESHQKKRANQQDYNNNNSVVNLEEFKADMLYEKGGEIPRHAIVLWESGQKGHWRVGGGYI